MFIWKRWFPLVLLGLALGILAACQTPTLPPPSTPRPTFTLPPLPSFTPLPTFTVGPGTPSPVPPTATDTPFPTPSPDYTLTPSPTARPGIDPTLGPTTPDPFITLTTPIPSPMPQLFFDAEVRNILLIGRDTAKGSSSYRTDVIIIASINPKNQAVTLLSIPRDLYVYIPGWTMNRINTAAVHGEAIKYPGGGMALLEQTILYNFGIPIHGWARIDFGGFQDIVDVLGGVDVPVTCAMQDWRLKDASYALTDEDPEHWELYTVETGVQHMDGWMALWYSRSRKRSSDFDRSRRQQQVLRAMFEKARSENLFLRAPELYNEYVEIMDTSLSLGDMLQFVPLAGQLETTRVKSRFVGRNQVFSWTTPGGAAVLLPDRDAITTLLAEAFAPPPDNVLARAPSKVELWNGTTHADWPALAADNLKWEGLTPILGTADRTDYAKTVIYDYTTSPKGSPIALLKTMFRVKDAEVIAAPDPNAPYPFRVILGADYNSCVRPTTVIRPTPTPGPGVITGDNVVNVAPIIGNNPPPMDGDLSEWTYLIYGIGHPLAGGEQWNGASDASAVWSTAWDRDYLYLAVRVRDDVRTQTARGESLTLGDSLELWLDTNPADDGLGDLTDNSWVVGLSPGDLNNPLAGPEAYILWPTSQRHPIEGAIIAPHVTEDGYDLEIAVPWSALGISPTAGQSFRFVLALNDNDQVGVQAQDTQLTNQPNQQLRAPNTWGVLVLNAPP